MKLEKGLQTTGYPHNIADGSLIRAVNVVFDDTGVAIKNERGMLLIQDADASGFVLIGIIKTDVGAILLEQKGAIPHGVNEIFRVRRYNKYDNSFTIVFQTNRIVYDIWAEDFTQLEGAYVYNKNKELVVAWWGGTLLNVSTGSLVNLGVNKRNLCIVNIDNLPFAAGLDANKYIVENNAPDGTPNNHYLTMFQNPTIRYPEFELLETVNNGGILDVGVYYVMIRYVYPDGDKTNAVGTSNKIVITNGSEVEHHRNIDGSEAGTNSGKSFAIKIKNLDTRYKEVEVLVYTLIANQQKAYRADRLKYSNSTNELDVNITGYNFEEISVEELLIDNIYINKVETGKQFEDRLYLGNITADNDVYLTDDEDKTFQRHALDIKLKWAADEHIGLTAVRDTFKSANTIFTKVSYTPGETYAFYAIPMLNNGKLGRAYHIPGIGEHYIEINGVQYSVLDNASTVDDGGINQPLWQAINDLKLYQTPLADRVPTSGANDFNFWQNKTEHYPNTEEFISASGIDYRGLNVRHHRFPTIHSLVNLDPDETLITQAEFNNSTVVTWDSGGLWENQNIKFINTDATPDKGAAAGAGQVEPFQYDVFKGIGYGRITGKNPKYYFGTGHAMSGMDVYDNSGVGYSGSWDLHAHTSVWPDVDSLAGYIIEIQKPILLRLNYLRLKNKGYNRGGAAILVAKIQSNVTNNVLSISDISILKTLSIGESDSATLTVTDDRIIPLSAGDRLFIHMAGYGEFHPAAGSGADGVEEANNAAYETWDYSRNGFMQVEYEVLNTINDISDKQTRLLSLRLDNIVIPTELRNKIQGIMIGYAKRSIETASKIGTSVVLNPYAGHSNQSIHGYARTYLFDTFVNGRQKIKLDYATIVGTKLNSTTNANIYTDDYDYDYKTDALETYAISEFKFRPEDNKIIDPSAYGCNEDNIVKFETTEAIKPQTMVYFGRIFDNMYLNFYNQSIVLTNNIVMLDRDFNISNGNYELKPEIKLKNYYGGDTYYDVFGTHHVSSDADSCDNVGLMAYHTYSLANIFLRTGDDTNKLYYPRNTATAFKEYCRTHQLNRAAKIPTNWEYNIDYSSLLDFKSPFAYNPNLRYLIHYAYRIIRSISQAKETFVLQWRDFKPDDYFEMPKYLGEIVAFGKLGNQLIIHHKKATYKALVKDVLKAATATEAQTYLSRGDLFDREPIEIMTDENGAIGCSHKNATLDSSMGHIVIDNERKAIYLIGEKIATLNGMGIKSLMDKIFSESIPDKAIFGNGISLGFDEQRHMLLFTFLHRDSKTPIDKYHTISYDLGKGVWQSYHTISANLYLSLRDKILAFYNHLTSSVTTEYKSYVLNANKNGLYGDQITNHESSIDIVFNKPKSAAKSMIDLYVQSTQERGHFNSVSWLSKYIDGNGIEVPDKTIDGIMIYNNTQCSGVIPINQNNEWYDNSTGRQVRDKWQFNEFSDKVIDAMQPFLDTNLDLINSNINLNSDWWEQANFISNFIVIRLIWGNIDDYDCTILDVDVNSVKNMR